MDSALMAVRENETETLESLLKSRDRYEYFSYVTGIGDNLLHEAVKLRHKKCVRFLIDKCPYLALKGNNRRELPIHKACELKVDLDIIEILLEVPDTLNMLQNEDQTPLFQAVKIYVAYLSNEKLNKKDRIHQCNIIKLLYDHGSYLNCQDYLGFTPLQVAIFDGCVEIVQLLLKLGAPTDIKDYSGRTSLCAAAISGNYNIIKAVLEKNPHIVNVGEQYSCSPLLCAAECACDKSVELLLKNGANINHTDRNGTTCLIAATRSRDVKNVIKLLEYGADPLLTDIAGNSPLTLACNYGLLDIVEFLLNHWTIFNYIVTDDSDFHPLICAIRSATPEILKYILKNHKFVDRSLCIKGSSLNNTFFRDGKIGVIGFLLGQIHAYQNINDMEKMLDMLLAKKFPLNAQDGSVPALTVVLQHNFKVFEESILKIVQQLIVQGADVYDMSLPINNWPFEDSHTVREFRSKLKIPDALVIAFRVDNVLGVKYLLRYWPQEPILLLLFYPSISLDLIKKWFKILIEYGWQPGSEASKKLIEFLNQSKFTEDVEFRGMVAENMQTPSTLKSLARFTARKLLADNMALLDRDMPQLVQALYIPPLIKRFLLMEH